MARVLKQIHLGDCSKDQGGLVLFRQITHLGYYWPIMKPDVQSFVGRCQAYQLRSNLFCALPVEFNSLSPLWPFYTWDIDLVAPINLPLEVTCGSLLLQNLQ